MLLITPIGQEESKVQGSWECRDWLRGPEALITGAYAEFGLSVQQRPELGGPGLQEASGPLACGPLCSGSSRTPCGRMRGHWATCCFTCPRPGPRRRAGLSTAREAEQ